MNQSAAPRPIQDEPRWSTAFEQFEPGRFPIVGPVGLGVHDWAQPKPGEPRMFEQGFLEWFTRAHPATLAGIYIPAAAMFLWRAFAIGLPLVEVGAAFVAGVFAWSLLEYLFHRFSFHFAPRTRIGVVFAYLIHGVHHAFPEDRRRWVMPPIVTVPVTIALVLICHPALRSYTWPVGAGVMLAYLWYDLLHYAIHRGPMRWSVLNALRKHHLQHHYATPERRYGVSTTLWDHVFGTLR
jgi:sterol desaturase/sphingolipid hydroxylase (fatty acid hydroxylase superfamily)